MQSALPPSPNAYVNIQPDGKAVIMARHLEMGQWVISWNAHYRTAPQTLLCLLEGLGPGQEPAAREHFLPIQQVHFGTRDLVFGGGYYRPEHAGYNDVADVSRLADYLAAQQPHQWTPADLQELKDVEAADRAEELDFVREWYPALCDLYERARQRQQIVIIELL